MKKLLNLIQSFHQVSFALVFLRLWLATVMFKHSSSYLFGQKILELADYLEGLGWPIPLFLAYASQIAELIASILLLLGIRLGAWLMAFTLGIAVVFAHGGKIYAEAELPFNYMAISMVLILCGCGPWSIDSWIESKSKKNV